MIFWDWLKLLFKLRGFCFNAEDGNCSSMEVDVDCSTSRVNIQHARD